jgi:3-hydroxyisobutyrate dehydrogenase-like beta-hydroxyacid dehydrogenase
LCEHATTHGVQLTESHGDAVRQSELVISAVTASQTVVAAQACTAALRGGSFFLDLNSASPRAKTTAAEHVVAVGARYVEGAVMAPVPPSRLQVPLLLGGPDAADLEPKLVELGFAPRLTSRRLGVASATKLCRSVMIKGMEAMLVEGLTAARHYGVEGEVLASLQETFPGIDWEQQAAYFFRRVIEHGRRRSEEMREAAASVQDVGLQPWSATATAERQAWIADLADAGLFGRPGTLDYASSADWRPEVDRILNHLKGA